MPSMMKTQFRHPNLRTNRLAIYRRSDSLGHRITSSFRFSMASMALSLQFFIDQLPPTLKKFLMRRDEDPLPLSPRYLNRTSSWNSTGAGFVPLDPGWKTSSFLISSTRRLKEVRDTRNSIKNSSLFSHSLFRTSSRHLLMSPFR